MANINGIQEPNMGLNQPTPEETPGPTWAELWNDNADTIGLHDHSPGNGVPVTPAGININAPLNMNSNKLLNTLVISMTPVSGSLTGPTNLNTLYVNGFQLWFTNGLGIAAPVGSGGGGGGGGSGSAGWTYTAIASYPFSVAGTTAGALIGVDTSAARTILLPAATTVVSFAIKDIVGKANINPITVTPNGTDQIEGINTNYNLAANWTGVSLTSDGISNWYLE